MVKHLIYTLALTLTFVASAAAQRQPNPGTQLVVGNTLSTGKLVGTEASAGVIDQGENIRYGNTYGMISENVAFTLSMNYAPYVNSLDVDNNVISGSWTMAVYKDGKYNGMLFGEITSGSIAWYALEESIIAGASVSAQLRIKGGTGEYAAVVGKDGSGTFFGEIVPGRDRAGTSEIHGFANLVY